MSHDPNAEKKMERRIGAMERDIASLGRAFLPGERSQREDSGKVMKDARWNCKKCNALLAWYDQSTDILRIRYKDHLVYSRVGGVGAEQLIEAVLEGVSLAGAALDDDQCRTIAQQVADVVTPGFMQIICRGCGEINTKAYMSEEEIEAAQAIAK